MADEAKTPVAIRIMRPYTTEEEFLARELDTLTRTSIVLLGAQQRPQGVVLRFEVALASGAPLVRGEGRVVGYKEQALGDLPGLTLRFTRLDSRSKALVDRAASLRDARSRPPAPVAGTPHPAGGGTPPRPPTLPPQRPTALRVSSAPAPSPPAPPAHPVLAASASPLELDLEATRAEAPHAKLRSERPPPPSVVPPRSVQRGSPRAPSVAATDGAANTALPLASAAPLDLEATHAEAPQPKRSSERPPASAPPDREALLQRLRDRRRSLDEDAVRNLLAKRTRA